MNKESIGIIFEPLYLKNITLKNRLIRAATYEGCADSNGFPQKELLNVYEALAQGGIGTLITGFVFISQNGRAMQPKQCGIDNDDKINAWSSIIQPLKKRYPETAIFMQLAHTGRQTRTEITRQPVLGVSQKKCSYFKQKVNLLTDIQITDIIEQFALAAKRAKIIGFDGVQIHAAHGYLIHQFLSSWTNIRKDRWKEKNLFLTEIIHAIRSLCGNNFPILVKLSAEDDNKNGIQPEDTIETAQQLKTMNVDAIEISYGTMEYAFNIIRGKRPIDTALTVNPLFNRINPILLAIFRKLFLAKHLKPLKPFSENYNLASATQIKANVPDLPIITIGGVRSLSSILSILSTKQADAISLSRPLIIEPNMPNKIRDGSWTKSACVNCNLCTIYCDTMQSTHCHLKRYNNE